MPRVTLVEQPAYEYTYTMMVRVTDINHAGHFGNEALLGLVHEARAHFLKALNFDTIVGSQQPAGLIIADMAVNFKAEGFAHEEVSVDSQIDEPGQKSFRLFHRIRRGGQVIALVETNKDKPTVIALREIAAGKVGVELLLPPTPPAPVL